MPSCSRSPSGSASASLTPGSPGGSPPSAAMAAAPAAGAPRAPRPAAPAAGGHPWSGAPPWGGKEEWGGSPCAAAAGGGGEGEEALAARRSCGLANHALPIPLVGWGRLQTPVEQRRTCASGPRWGGPSLASSKPLGRPLLSVGGFRCGKPATHGCARAARDRRLRAVGAWFGCGRLPEAPAGPGDAPGQGPRPMQHHALRAHWRRLVAIAGQWASKSRAAIAHPGSSDGRRRLGGLQTGRGGRAARSGGLGCPAPPPERFSSPAARPQLRRRRVVSLGTLCRLRPCRGWAGAWAAEGRRNQLTKAAGQPPAAACSPPAAAAARSLLPPPLARSPPALSPLFVSWH